MTGVLDRIEDSLGAHGLTLTKTYPRGPGHLILQITDPLAARVGGQWFADPDRANDVAEQTELRTGGTVRVPVLDRRVVVQRAGVDRTLASLQSLVLAPGSTLVAHRVERRGVVRRTQRGRPTTYAKVLRPKRTPATVDRARLTVEGVVLPRPTVSDIPRGLVVFDEVPGVRLIDVLANPTTSAGQLRRAGLAVGEALARLHRTPAPADLGVHDASAELEVAQTWLAHATSYGLLDSRLPVREHLERLCRFSAEPGCYHALIHRDLHDKQVLIGEGDVVGMLDFDLATTGEPALDLANLLVHLELRAVQGRCPAEAARDCAQALVDGYAPRPEVWRRVPGYALATRLRLAAVYSFRPGSAWIGPSLLARGVPGALPQQEVFA